MNAPLRVLMNADTVGGVWTYAMELCRALGDGVEILLATAGAPLSAGQRRQVGALPHVAVAESQYRLEWMPEPWEDVDAAGMWLRRLADRFRPDVVHLNDYSHAAADWPAPVVVVGHSCVLSWHEAVRGTAAGAEWDGYRRRVAAGLHAADVVVAPTAAFLVSLDRHYGPLHESRVIVNGVASVGSPDREAKERIIFAAGRLWDEAKNVAALCEVAADLPWPVEIAGLPHPNGVADDFPAFANVRLLGRLDAAAMDAAYRRAAAYVLPARYEPFGLTPLEAAVRGCALVLGDIPTLRELWDGAAIFVPPDDPAALRDAVAGLIADPVTREKHGATARRRAAWYTAARMAAAYRGLYRTLPALSHA